MTTNYVTSVANSAINSFYIGQDGKLGFKTEDFTKSLYSANTISGALGAGITAGLNATTIGYNNQYVNGFNSQQIRNIKTFNSLMGDLITNTSSLLMGENATFNILNLTDFGTRINGGLLEFTIGKDGISSKIGNGGTNISYSNIKSSIAGIKEASKVTDWKYGSLESSSTMNSINMLAYTNSKDNLKIAKDIWNENLAVEYGNTGNDYGNYTIGERKIVLSEKLLGGGKEASAKIATVMSHEGTHYNGKRVEALAHLAGAETYAFLNNKFTLQADISFSMEMLAGIMNADNWKENTGDVDHWKMTWGGQLVSDGSGWLKDENGMYISKDGTRTTEPIPGETLGAEKQESGLLNIMNGESAQLYNTFSDEQKQQAQAIMESAGLEMDKTGQWNNALGKKVDMTDVMTVAGEKIADPVFETYYNNKVDYDLATAYGLDLKFSETAMNKTVPEVLQGKYSELMSQHMQETDSPAALMNKYTWSIYDKDGIATQLFKIDENNSFLDDLLGQHDFKGEKGSAEYTIDKWGCNFMTIISYSQLLTGQAFSKDQILDIWAQSVKLEYINEKDAFVQNRNNISLVAMQMLDLNDMYISFDNINFTNNYTPIGNRIGWLNSDGTPYHFSNGSIYNSNLYNPGYTIKPNYSTTPVKLWW